MPVTDPMQAHGTEDREGCRRRGISAMNKGNTKAVEHFFFAKVAQTCKATSNLPAVARVRCFAVLRVLIEYVSEGDRRKTGAAASSTIT
jgi:hypothetical protein